MTVIIPFPSPWHGPFIQAAADGCDLGWAVVSAADSATVARGLALVNNDACYDTLVAAAQAVEGAESAGVLAGEAPEVAVPLLCHGCRSADKPYLVQEALVRVGYGEGRVFSLLDAIARSEFVPDQAQRRLAGALAVADSLLQLRLRLRPHIPPAKFTYFDAIMDSWRQRALAATASQQPFDAGGFIEDLDSEAARLFGVRRVSRPIVGVAGSASALFDPAVNGGLTGILEDEGCEVRLPYLASLMAFTMEAQGLHCPFGEELDGLCLRASQALTVIPAAAYGSNVRECGARFAPAPLSRGLGCAVAGWIVQLLQQGIDDIVYAGHFGCLTGHVSGAGVLGPLRRAYPQANIAAVEYDPGTSSLNQVNRLKLLASIAWRKTEGEGL